LDICHGQRREREMSLYLVFEHVHQDLASYLEKCPPPGLGQDRIKVSWNIIYFISYYLISDEKQQLSYNTISCYSSSLHQIITDERRQVASLNFSIYNVSTRQFQCKRNNSKLISLALYSLNVFLKAEIFLQQGNFCFSG
jgi:hypothetical protein